MCQVAAWSGEGVCPSAEVGGPERRKAAAGLCGPGSLSGSSSCTLLNSSHTFRLQRPGFPPTQPLPGTRARLPPRRLPGSHVPCVLAVCRGARAPERPRATLHVDRPSRRVLLPRTGVAVVCARPPSPCRSARGAGGLRPSPPGPPWALLPLPRQVPRACRPTCPQIAPVVPAQAWENENWSEGTVIHPRTVILGLTFGCLEVFIASCPGGSRSCYGAVRGVAVVHPESELSLCCCRFPR